MSLDFLGVAEAAEGKVGGSVWPFREQQEKHFSVEGSRFEICSRTSWAGNVPSIPIEILAKWTAGCCHEKVNKVSALFLRATGS